MPSAQNLTAFQHQVGQWRHLACFPMHGKQKKLRRGTGIEFKKFESQCRDRGRCRYRLQKMKYDGHEFQEKILADPKKSEDNLEILAKNPKRICCRNRDPLAWKSRHPENSVDDPIEISKKPTTNRCSEKIFDWIWRVKTLAENANFHPKMAK